MNNKAVTLSLVMAVIAVFFVQSYVSSIEERTRRRFGAEVLVVKAKDDIKEMSSLNETMLELKRIPKRFLEPVAVSFDSGEGKEEAIKDMKRLAGAIAIVPIKKGEQITYNKISEVSLRTGLSPQITPGKRAVAVPVNEVSGVSKLVKPGDRVDLIAVLDYGSGSRKTKVAKTILQDAVVLSVGQNVTNNVARLVEKGGRRDKVRSLATYSGFSSVTVEVEPVQAQSLALIVALGRASITLSLRNNDDSERMNTGRTTLPDVLGLRAPASSNSKAGAR